MKKDKLIVRITAMAVIIFLIGIFIINDYWEEKVMGSEKIASGYEGREEIVLVEKELKEGVAAYKASEDIVNPRLKEMEEEIAIDMDNSTVELTEEATIEDHKVASPIETTKNTQTREVTQPASESSPAPESEPISEPVPNPEEAPAQIPEAKENPVEEPAPEPIPEVEPKPEVEPVPEITPAPESEPISEPEHDQTDSDKNSRSTQAESFSDSKSERKPKRRFNDGISKRQRDNGKPYRR